MFIFSSPPSSIIYVYILKKDLRKQPQDFFKAYRRLLYFSGQPCPGRFVDPADLQSLQLEILLLSHKELEAAGWGSEKHMGAAVERPGENSQASSHSLSSQSLAPRPRALGHKPNVKSFVFCLFSYSPLLSGHSLRGCYS